MAVLEEKEAPADDKAKHLGLWAILWVVATFIVYLFQFRPILGAIFRQYFRS